MTTLTERELSTLLRANPDIRMDGAAPVQRLVSAAHPAQRGEPEHEMQAAIIAKVDELAEHDPRWRYLFAVPNGGHRHPAVAAKLKAEGVRKGVIDLWWPLKAHGYVGLVLELKAGKNDTTPEQDDWLAWLSSQGWYARVVRDDADKAMALLTWYISGAPAVELERKAVGG